MKGWGVRAHQEALLYLIPNHKNPPRPSEKGITVAELTASYERLIDEGEITRAWFDEYLTRCSREGGCSFTSIGGILSLLCVARYAERGVYRRL